MERVNQRRKLRLEKRIQYHEKRIQKGKQKEVKENKRKQKRQEKRKVEDRKRQIDRHQVQQRQASGGKTGRETCWDQTRSQEIDFR